jgi:molybdopterin converting factor small subunit
MADPFSSASAVIGTVDGLLRFSAWLRKAVVAAERVDAEVQDLIHDIERLIPIYNSLNVLQDKATSHPALGGQGQQLGRSVEHLRHIESLWHAAGETIRRCTDTVDQLERILKSITGESSEIFENLETIEKSEKAVGSEKAVKTNETQRILAKVTQKFSGLRKELKRQSKEPQYLELRRDLQSYHTALNTSLIALQMWDLSKARPIHR